MGCFVAEQLTAAGVQTAALVRDPQGGTEARKRKVSTLRAWGVQLVTCSLDVELAQLAELLQSFDTIISLLKGDALTNAYAGMPLTTSPCDLHVDSFTDSEIE